MQLTVVTVIVGYDGCNNIYKYHKDVNVNNGYKKQIIQQEILHTIILGGQFPRLRLAFAFSFSYL